MLGLIQKVLIWHAVAVTIRAAKNISSYFMKMRFLKMKIFETIISGNNQKSTIKNTM